MYETKNHISMFTTCFPISAVAAFTRNWNKLKIKIEKGVKANNSKL